MRGLGMLRGMCHVHIFLGPAVGHHQEPSLTRRYVPLVDAASVLVARAQTELGVHGEAVERKPRLVGLQGNLSTASVSLSSPNA